MLFRLNPIKLLLRQNIKTISIRYCSTEQNHQNDCNQNVSDRQVRVRFAPSPTGKFTFKNEQA